MADFLKTLKIKGIEIDTDSASSGQVLAYNGTKFVPTPSSTGSSGASVSDSPPSSPTSGQLWFESDTGKTYVYYDSYWVEVGTGASYPVINTVSITTNSATTIYSFAKADTRSAELLIQVTQGSKYTVSKILLIHDGTTATLAEYGVIELGTTRIPLNISTTVSGANVLVQATVTDASSTTATVKVTPTLLPV